VLLSGKYCKSHNAQELKIRHMIIIRIKMREKYTRAILMRDKPPPDNATPIHDQRFNKGDFRL
jgi:hypothetical protein